MSNENRNRPGQMSLQAWIAVIFVPMMAVVFPILIYLAQEYGFFRGDPLAFISIGLGISVVISVLLGAAYARFEPVRKGAAVARRILDRASQAFSTWAHSKWGFRIATACLLTAMLLLQWLIHPSIPAVIAFALQTLLLLTLVVLHIDRKPRRPIYSVDTFDHGLISWTAEDLGRATVNEGVGVPPPCLDLFPVPNVAALKYVLAFRGIPELRRGTIECDVRLTSNSLLNILFMADIVGRRFYMARVDSRSPWGDSFVEMEPPYKHWELRAQSQRVTPVGQWVHIRLEVGSTSAVLYRDNGEIVRIALSDFRHKPEGYQIGLFCELGAVLVDNFAVAIA